MAWACMVANGTESLVFIEDVTTDRNGRMNSEMYSAILSTQIQLNAAKLIGWHFSVQMDNDPKHIVKATQGHLMANKLNVLNCPMTST